MRDILFGPRVRNEFLLAGLVDVSKHAAGKPATGGLMGTYQIPGSIRLVKGLKAMVIADS